MVTEEATDMTIGDTSQGNQAMGLIMVVELLTIIDQGFMTLREQKLRAVVKTVVLKSNGTRVIIDIMAIMAITGGKATFIE